MKETKSIESGERILNERNDEQEQITEKDSYEDYVDLDDLFSDVSIHDNVKNSEQLSEPENTKQKHDKVYKRENLEQPETKEREKASADSVEEICIESNINKYLVYNKVDWRHIQFWFGLMKLFSTQRQQTITFSCRKIISLLRWGKDKSSYKKIEDSINFFAKEIEFKNYCFWSEKDKKKKKIKSIKFRPIDIVREKNYFHLKLHPYLYKNLKSGIVVWKKINWNQPKIIQKFLFVLDTIMIPYHKRVKNQILSIKNIDLNKYFTKSEIMGIKRYYKSFKENLSGTYYEILDLKINREKLSLEVYTNFYTQKTDYYVEKYGDLIDTTEKLIACFFTNKKKNPSLERKLSQKDVKYLMSFLNKNGLARTTFLIYYISQEIETAVLKDFGKFSLIKLFKRFKSSAMRMFLQYDGKKIEKKGFNVNEYGMIFAEFFVKKRKFPEIVEKIFKK